MYYRTSDLFLVTYSSNTLGIVVFSYNRYNRCVKCKYYLYVTKTDCSAYFLSIKYSKNAYKVRTTNGKSILPIEYIE